jgi:hypothetical protein
MSYTIVTVNIYYTTTIILCTFLQMARAINKLVDSRGEKRAKLQNLLLEKIISISIQLIFCSNSSMTIRNISMVNTLVHRY